MEVDGWNGIGNVRNVNQHTYIKMLHYYYYLNIFTQVDHVKHYFNNSVCILIILLICWTNKLFWSSLMVLPIQTVILFKLLLWNIFWINIVFVSYGFKQCFIYITQINVNLFYFPSFTMIIKIKASRFHAVNFIKTCYHWKV